MRNCYIYFILCILLDLSIVFAKAQSPGGVNSNLYLWLKAGSGVTQSSNQVTAWANQASGVAMSTQPSYPSASSNIILANNRTNFNPAITFTGASGYCLTGSYVTNPNNAPLIFAVATGGTGTGGNYLGDIYSNSFGGSTGMVYDATTGNFDIDGSGYSCSPTFANYKPSVVRAYYNSNSSSLGAYIALNGITSSSCSSGAIVGEGNSFEIGGRTWGPIPNRIFVGDISEVIYYKSNTATAAQINQVESYLALKYGITLGSNSSVMNYTSSNGTTIWSGNSTYQNDVFGIGTDNGSGLTQTQSNSMNNGSGNGVGQSGKGNLTLSAPSALADQQFLMVGDDAGALTEETNNLPTGTIGSKRVVRNWLVQNIGSVGTVNLSFDMTGLTLTGGATAANYRLLVNSNTDATFATGTPTHYFPSSITGNLINFTGVSLPNNTVFTLITFASGTTLPAIWVSFTAVKQGTGALLNWATSNEVNVSLYEVEYSPDGNSYSSIGRIEANNNMSMNNYSFQIPSLSNGTNYFRIKRVDLDGVSNYSNILEINNILQFFVSIEPNPIINNLLNFHINSPKQGHADFSILGMDGRVFLRQDITFQSGTTTKKLDISGLAAGAYMARILIDGNLKTLRFIKN